jgi:KUP system potassium uptake protein
VWRESLLSFQQRNAERSAAFFGVPTNQMVEFGTGHASLSTARSDARA